MLIAALILTAKFAAGFLIVAGVASVVKTWAETRKGR